MVKKTTLPINPDIFLFTGEASGDLHGEALLQSLYAKRPDLSIFGVGGKRMRATPFQSILAMEKFQVMGFIDVFLALPKIIQHFYFLRNQILQSNPKIALFIDYPGFSLRMEKHLKKKGFQGEIIHYICPSVWAWGKRRISFLEKNTDLLLSIFPFEKSFFSPLFPVKYIGHPLVTRIKEAQIEPFPWAFGKKVISLFPGSRKKEIQRNFPLQLRALKTLLQHEGTLGAISLSQEAYRPLLEELVQKEGLDPTKLKWINSKEIYGLMQHSFLAIAKSGTVTLELAFHAIPTVVLYATSKLDFWIAWHLLKIRLPFYCIVNIAAKKEVFKEFFGPYTTQENLNQEVLRLYQDTVYREGIKELCAELLQSFGRANSSAIAAEELLSRLKKDD